MSAVDAPDWLAVLAATRLVAAELSLERLFKVFLTVTLERSGAQIGSLLVPSERFCRLERSETAHLFSQTLLTESLPADPGDAPLSLLSAVLQQKTPLLIDHGVPDQRAVDDPYLLRHQPRSLWCLPLLQNTQLVGLLCLEHQQLDSWFDSNKQMVVQQLCAQWLVSLVNARSYQACQAQLKSLPHASSMTSEPDESLDLLSREDFDLRLVHEWRRLSRDGLPLSLVLCRPDQWEALQATHGQRTVEAAFYQVARIIRGRLKRVADILARYDDNTLAVLLPSTPWEGVIHLAEGIREATSRIMLLPKPGELAVPLNLSMGITSVLSCQETLPEVILDITEDLLSNAQAAGGGRILSENV